MCKPASMIITKDDVLWLRGSNSHENIIKENNLNDNTNKPNFVRIEITPPVKDDLPQYNVPLDEWEYRTDQDLLPKWYVASVDEERARKALFDWYKSHIEGQITDASNIMQQAGSDSTQTAGSDSTQTAGNCSTQTAGNYSTQTAGFNSTQTAINCSTQTAGNCSTQTAGNDSTQKAGFNSTQTARNCSTQTAGNYSTQTAGLNSVQICYWYDNSDYKVATRIVTEKEANKPYYFENGIWNLVK